MCVRNLGQVGCAAVVVNLRSVLENGVILICETTSFNYLPRLFFFFLKWNQFPSQKMNASSSRCYQVNTELCVTVKVTKINEILFPISLFHHLRNFTKWTSSSFCRRAFSQLNLQESVCATGTVASDSNMASVKLQPLILQSLELLCLKMVIL